LRLLSLLMICFLFTGCSPNKEIEADSPTNQENKKQESTTKNEEAALKKIMTDTTDEFGATLLKELFKDSETKIEVKEMGSFKDSQSALEDGAIDVMTGVSDKQEPSEDDRNIDMTYSYFYDDDNQNYWVYTVKKENKEVLKLLNEKLLEARENGTYQEIYNQFYEDDAHSVLIAHEQNDKQHENEKKETASNTAKEESNVSSSNEDKQSQTSSKKTEPKEEPAEEVSNPVSINPSGVQVVNGQFSVEGITLGTTLENVKSKLGKPTYEGPDQGEMEAHDHVTKYGPLYIGYNNNTVTAIIFDVNSSVRSTGWFNQLPNQTTEGDGNYYYIEGSSNYFKIEPADSPAYAYVLYTGPEFESEKDRKKRESNKMSADEAVQAVINQENLDEYPQLIVEHDHNEDDRYVIHVYEIVGEGTEDAHTATWGWYYVDPYSGDVTSMF
ncbi:MAG: transporter substrate-binding domain-containing protein, partial [Anaerobacillus sp.]